MSIRSQFLVLSALIALILGAVLVYVFSGWRGERQDLVEQIASDSARAAAAATRSVLVGALRVERDMGHELALPTLTAANRKDYLSRVLGRRSEEFLDFYYLTGDQILNGRAPSRSPAELRLDRAVNAVLHGRPWSLTYQPSVRSSGSLHLAVAVEPGSGGRGVLLGVIPVRWLLASLHAPADLKVALVDSTGQVIAVHPGGDVPEDTRGEAAGQTAGVAPDSASVAAALEGADTWQVYRAPDARHYLGAYSPVQGFGWAAAARIDMDMAMAPMYHRERRAYLGFGVGLLAVLLFLRMATAGLLHSIFRVQRGAQILAGGDVGYRISTVQMNPGAEMRSLAETFNNMAERLQAHQDLLHDRNQQLNVLLRVVEGLRTERDPQELLRRITQDAAFVTSAGVSFLAQVDAERLRLKEWWDGVRWVSLDMSWGSGQGVPGWVWLHHDTRTSDDPELGQAPAPEIRENVKIKHYICAPITLPTNGTVVGVLFVGSTTEESAFTDDDIRIMELLARHAGVALEVEGHFQRERRIGVTLQKAMLPDVDPDLAGLSIAREYQAASDETELGGDFYDVIPLGRSRIGLVIADVSGKGIRAAVQTAAVKYALRAYALEDPSPSTVLARLNNCCCAGPATRERGFVTLFYGVIDLDRWVMRYANAGHQPPLLRRVTGMVEALESDGVVLGVADSTLVSFPEGIVDLRAGDTLVLYTDGLSEARHGEDFLDTEGLQDLLGQLDVGAHETAKLLLEEATTFADGTLRDDVALLVVKIPNPLPAVSERIPMENSFEF